MTAVPGQPESVFFLDDPAKLEDPYPSFAYFREHEPILFHEPLNSWFIFRYDDVLKLFHDPRLSADRMKGFVETAPKSVQADLRKIAPFLERWVMMRDGADHAHIRNLLSLGFNPQRVRGLEPSIRAIVDELLQPAAANGRFDVCEDFAFLLPAYLLSDMLGISAADRRQVLQWSVDFVDFFNQLPITEETTRRLLASGNAMIDYTRRLLSDRRAHPQEDFLGVLLQAASKDPTFSDDDIVANAMVLLLAGHVAVRNLIGNAVDLLIHHPDQMAEVVAKPELLHAAIEETLRYEPPVVMIPRIALEDFEYGEAKIREGHIVQLVLASANRDEGHFRHGDAFFIFRPAIKHLSFADGPHACLGASLAVEEARIALGTLLERFPKMRIDYSLPIKWYRTAGSRGPSRLPVILG